MPYYIWTEHGKLLAITGEMDDARHILATIKAAYYIKDKRGAILRTKGSVKKAEILNRISREESRKNNAFEA